MVFVGRVRQPASTSYDVTTAWSSESRAEQCYRLPFLHPSDCTCSWSCFLLLSVASQLWKRVTRRFAVTARSTTAGWLLRLSLPLSRLVDRGTHSQRCWFPVLANVCGYIAGSPATASSVATRLDTIYPSLLSAGSVKKSLERLVKLRKHKTLGSLKTYQRRSCFLI